MRSNRSLCRHPQGALHNGSLDLMFMHGLKGLSGRLQYLDMLIKSEEGGHVALDYVRSEKVGRGRAIDEAKPAAPHISVHRSRPSRWSPCRRRAVEVSLAWPWTGRSCLRRRRSLSCIRDCATFAWRRIWNFDCVPGFDPGDVPGQN